jgi:predicted phage terminase large subunit-like protein
LCFADASGLPLRQAQIHVELQQFLSNHKHAIVELPRDHGKSTQVCIRVLWELGRDPTLRICIVCANEERARERMVFLRNEIAHNRYLRSVFPGMIPRTPWTETHFNVQRPSNVIGHSVTAFGVGASSTGIRSDLLICDDIVDVRAMHSRPIRERTKEYFRNNLMNLLEPTGRCWSLSTPWHRDDLNSELKQQPAFALFRRPIGPDMEPIWPERWSRERLIQREQEIGTASFARGYRLAPVSQTETPIRPEWVSYWLEPEPLEQIILSIDPAVSVKPASDASALVVLGKTPDGVVRCLHAVAHRARLPDLVRHIQNLDKVWNPQVILFESNGPFGGIRDLLIHNTPFGSKVRGITRNENKLIRVESFSIWVQKGRFQLRGSEENQVHPSQNELFDEMTMFPFGDHDDLVDAAAMGTTWLLLRKEPGIW